MKTLKLIRDRYLGLSDYCRMSFSFGFYGMLVLYITSIAANLMAPYVGDYLRAMTVYYGMLEAAPAMLASGVCAGLICDLIQKGNSKSKDQ